MSKIYSISLVLMGLCLSIISNAAPVPISNPGFETQILANGAFTTGTATGWTIAGTGGAFNPTNVNIPPTGAPEGQNTHFIDSGNTSQVLTTNLLGDTIYTLNTDVCDRGDLAPGVYLVELLAGTTVIGSDANTLVPSAPGTTCLTSTVSYTSTATDADIGNPLQIRLSLVSGRQINFDNLRLDATAVPVATPVPTLSQWMLGLLAFSLILISFKLRRVSL